MIGVRHETGTMWCFFNITIIYIYIYIYTDRDFFFLYIFIYINITFRKGLKKNYFEKIWNAIERGHSMHRKCCL